MVSENVLYFYLRFVASMDYYGLSLGVSILPGSIYINMFLSGLIELPCYIMACILLNKVGRRWPNAGTLVASGVCCVLIGIFIYHTGKSNTIISYLFFLDISLMRSSYIIQASQILSSVIFSFWTSHYRDYWNSR